MRAEPIYKLDNLDFDGPLDLLLSLLNKNKVDIYDIPIALITDQYLDFMASMEETDLDIVSDFILMAATLMDIKAKMLLPVTESDEEEEPYDPREDLVRRLIAYKRCKYAAAELKKCAEAAGRAFYSRRGLPGELEDLAPDIDIGLLTGDLSLRKLHDIYESLIRRMKKATDAKAVNFGVIRRDRASLAEYLDNLVRYARDHRKFKFHRMLGDHAEREKVVVSFLALLELTRLGRVNVRQYKQFGEINVEVIDGNSLGEFDLIEVVDG